MGRFYKYTFLCSLVLFTSMVFGQFLNAPVSLTGKNINTYFLKDRQEVQAASSFFNVLFVKNTGDKELHYRTEITIPSSWSFFENVNDSGNVKSIAPGDSVYIPFRISVSGSVKGGVGYVVVGKIFEINREQKKEQLVKTVYCFLTVPRQNNLSVRPKNYVEFFDLETKMALMAIHVSNRGNVNEVIDLNFDLKNSVYMPGGLNEKYTTSVSVSPRKDTVLHFWVKRVDDYNFNDRLRVLQFTAATQDTTFHLSVSFKTLRNTYTKLLDESARPLVIEMYAENLLTEAAPSLLTTARGNVLLKRSRELYYYMRFSGQRFYQDIWRRTSMYAGFKNKHLNLMVGDVGLGLEQNTSGRGLVASYRNKKHSIQAVATRRLYFATTNLGGMYGYSFNSRMRLSAGASFQQNPYQSVDSRVGFVSGNVHVVRGHSIGFRYGLSEASFYRDPLNTFVKPGYAYGFNYSGQFKKKATLKFDTRYGSADYTGTSRGRYTINGTATYAINGRTSSSFNYYFYGINPITDLYATTQIRKFDQEYMKMWLYHSLSPRLNLYGGPSVETFSSNNFRYMEDVNEVFKTRTARMYVGLRIRTAGDYNYIRPYASYGLTFVTDYPKHLTGIAAPEEEEVFPFGAMTAGLHIAQKYWGVSTSYYYGPYTIQQQYNYLYFKKYYKTIRLMPYYERFIYEDEMKLSTRLNYLYDVITKDNRISLNNVLYWYLEKGWTLNLRHNLYYSSSRIGDNDPTKYFSNYVDFGFRKEFEWQQPRLKYWDIRVVFFKDLNGNRIKDDNEPGIRNVLVNIERDEHPDNPYNAEYNGEYTPVELLTDAFGKITYHNIAEGNYQIKYKLMESVQGHFNILEKELNVVINSNSTVFVPFVENNTVFGGVHLNRAEFSTLGRIDLIGIKVTATDSAGNSFSTLTNNEGKFILSVPNAGLYKVSINNIFYENFEIIQNDYFVDFNGYKRFEITFVFNEVPRKINFTVPVEDASTGFDNSSVLLPENERPVKSQLSSVSRRPEDIEKMQQRIVPEGYQPTSAAERMDPQGKRFESTTEAPVTGSTGVASAPVVTEDSQVFLEPVATTRYFIVAGAYRDKALAVRAVQGLKAKGFDKARLIGTSSDGLTRISYNHFDDNRQAAITEMSRIRKYESGAAWLLEQSSTTMQYRLNSVNYDATNPIKGNEPVDNIKTTPVKAVPETGAGQEAEPTNDADPLDMMPSEPEQLDENTAIGSPVPAPAGPSDGVTEEPETPVTEMEIGDDVLKILEDLENEPVRLAVDTGKIVRDIASLESEPLPAILQAEVARYEPVDITQPGLLFKVQFTVTIDMMRKQRDMAGMPDLVRLKADSAPAHLYFSDNFPDYEEAKMFMGTLMELGFSQVAVVPFKDGRMISLKEAASE